MNGWMCGFRLAAVARPVASICCSRAVISAIARPYVSSGIGMPYFCVDRMMIGVRYAMISTMYCAICVQVTARMPPSIEQSRMPASPT